MSQSKKLIESPFTWNIGKEIILNFVYDFEYQENLDDEYEHPIIPIIQTIVKTYVLTVREDYDEAEKQLQKITDIWNNLDHRQIEIEKVSVEVLIHITEATKYHFYQKLGATSKAQEIIDNIKDFRDFQLKEDHGTINGCKSITWLMFNETRKKSAIYYARLAVLINSDCPTWQFILGKSLRILRRIETYGPPSSEEIDSLSKSYELSKNPHYGIYVATSYRENTEYDKAMQINLEIYNLNPSNYMIKLRLALAFIRQANFEKAKSCLDYVEKIAPDNTMFQHYQGIYHFKKRNYEKAVVYFKNATSGKHIGVDLHYVQCMVKLNKNFDALKYMKNVLEKYESQTGAKQKLLLLIGIHYYCKHKDVINSLDYILKAIELDTKNYQLLERLYDIMQSKEYNIFNFLNDTLFPEYDRYFGTSLVLQDNMKKLRDFCDEYYRNKK